jgi:hypothetical protein
VNAGNNVLQSNATGAEVQYVQASCLCDTIHANVLGAAAPYSTVVTRRRVSVAQHCGVSADTKSSKRTQKNGKTDYSHPNKVPEIFEVSFQLFLSKENTKIPDQIAVTQLRI